ncbi:hypothetical protein RFI_11392 [Reticulomyxa filosa]|uniref:Uncharacterized protein n=1 Tax=Reticulomyxa filosa TaxID=46433 RepID=X6NIC9_RETFI|nr:hypothetical protein RFI_11392 [Reticulomyxa filosa]|eukprot:ETO25746.1 hypothetical protein RFI_11392 [Reticulomyxa filosa]
MFRALLAGLLRACASGVQKRDNTNERNPMWIVDDLFHIQKTNLDYLPALCLFFPDMLTNMKHLSWQVQQWCGGKLELDELNATLCQNSFELIHQTIESWLKYTHDSVRANVVIEVMTLFVEMSTSHNSIARKPPSSNSDFAKFLLEHIKQSILVAIKQHYNATSILKDLALELPNKVHATRVVAKLSKAARMKGVSKRDEWQEYIEEIEMLFIDESEVSIALWRYGIFEVIPEIGLETLALEYVTDTINLLSADQTSLDIQYRVVLSAASRLQLLLQSLCTKYATLEKENCKTIRR